MKKVLMITSMLLITIGLFSIQLNEVFDYSGSFLGGQGQWVKHSGTTDDLILSPTNLSMENYSSQSIGKSASFGSGSGDYNCPIPEKTQGTFFISFLFKATSCGSGSYFFHTANSSGASDVTAFGSRIFAKANGTSLQFGASNTNTGTYCNTNYNFNTTYLIILAYNILSGTNNDELKVWIKTSVPNSYSELGNPDITTIGYGTLIDLTIFKSICIRQASGGANALIDGIRVGYGSDYSSAWNDLGASATLPVTFSSFNAALTGSQTVSLAWTTESESSLRGFNIYRSENNNTVDAIAVSPMIAANNTSSASNYSFTDDEVSVNNTYYYWVVSTEQNGHNEWYGPCNITVNGSVTPQVPTSTELYKAYPNPINTNRANLNIECKVGTEETAMLTIYNVKGQSVKTYNLNSGVHNVQWDGKDLNGNRCSSGVYFYRLEVNGFTEVKRMTLLK